MTIQENVSLKPYNTFGIDAKADYLITYNSVDDLREVIESDIVRSNQVLAMGGGSNLLFLSDFKGAILQSDIKFISPIDENEDSVLIEIGAGVVWDDLVAHCVEKSWYGIENLSLVPGHVGAAAVQNIGAYGVEIKDVIERVNALEISSNKSVSFSQAECKYGYRDSIFKNQYKGKYIVTSVLLRLSKTPVYSFEYCHLETAVRDKGEITLQNIRNTIIEIREQKLPDPAKQGNGGSFFKNPVISKGSFLELQQQYPAISHYYISATEEKISAAWLIDQCGWKGKHIGNAGVHDKQPLVLINMGNATGKEIADLAAEIQLSVKNKFGIELHPEVNYISCKY
ncbi:UDP-N-acetylmuramate dehydrogenase [Paludibacter sp. 221]|uniref:UDP-N-acetylmuramate dehydrogenase n=1 Tax=Paludibacter sp. 221 TaxID=2302939 RepID=UPI0013D8ACC2|nr:UDP-N-acetylmuramate dehydrogenase [Paludibacter sp. 221]NDV46780.1 UDP-N-acetylmuramate dehydrogenase [Paludibacter sp. 221]